MLTLTWFTITWTFRDSFLFQRVKSKYRKIISYGLKEGAVQHAR
ncbi:hypothetical protein M2277_003094 [Paenibacillus sp. LBL]|nr:hypothetical protein [Paenibacillus sp. LBL]